MAENNSKDHRHNFIELLQQKKFKEALHLLKALPESEQVEQLEKVYTSNETKNKVDVSKLKTVSLLDRKLKPEYTYC